MNNIEEIIKKISKDIDFTGVMMSLDKLEKPEVIPFGIQSLDDITGLGGIARGRITEIYGAQSNGKTSLCLRLISEAQKLGIKTAFIDAEMAMNKDLAEKMGVDIKSLLIAQPISGEETFELIESLSNNGWGLVVVDSVSAMIPEDESEADFDQQSIGLQARLMSKGMRKILGVISKNNTALVFTNQVRDDINKMGFGPKTTTSGGRALRFYATLRLDCARTGWIAKEKEKIGMEIKITTNKNKLHRPMLETNLRFMFDNGFDILGDKLDCLVSSGKIELNARTYYHGNNKIGDRDEAIEYIKNNQV